MVHARNRLWSEVVVRKSRKCGDGSVIAIVFSVTKIVTVMAARVLWAGVTSGWLRRLHVFHAAAEKICRFVCV